jgi:hypothetical protein
MATTMTAHGIKAKLHPGWNGRIYQEVLAPPEVMGPIMHMGNFAIPMTDTGFAGQMMGQVTSGKVAFVYMEYVPDDVIRPGVGLYSAQGFPPPFTLDDFSPTNMQVSRPGQVGAQRFFSVGDRPIVLYAVVGTGDGAEDAVASLNATLGDLQLATSPTGSDYAVVPRRAR